MKNRQPNLTILMADDDCYDSLLCHDGLVESRLPIKVYMVMDDKELMDYLSHHRLYTDVNKATLLCLILLELNMGKKDGPHIIQVIKNNRQNLITLIIFIRNSTTEVDIYHTYNLGANSFIQKPVNFTSLFTSLISSVEVITTIGQYWFQIVQLPI